MSRPIRVLIIEDSECDALLVVRRLQRSGFDPVWKRVQAAESLREALVEQNWDIAFCDHSMPGFGSRDALAIVREQRPDIPLVILSGNQGNRLCIPRGYQFFAKTLPGSNTRQSYPRLSGQNLTLTKRP